MAGNTLTLADARTLAIRQRFALASDVRAFAFTPDAAALVVASKDGLIHRVSLDDETVLGLFQVQDPTFLELNHSGDTLVVITQGRVETWNLREATRIAAMPEHSDGYKTALFTSDDKQLIGFGALDNKNVSVWDPASGERQGGHFHRDSALVVAISQTSTLVASADETSPDVALWDRTNSDPPILLKGHGARVHAADFSPDGSLLATAGQDRTIILWDIRRQLIVADLVGHCSSVRQVQFDERGRHLVSVSDDGEVRLWELVSMPEQRIQGGPTGSRINYDDANVVQVGFAGQGRFVVVAGVTYTSVFDRQSGQLIDTAPVRARFVDSAESWGVYERSSSDRSRSGYQHGSWKVDDHGKLSLAETLRLDDSAVAVTVDRHRIIARSKGALSLFVSGDERPAWSVPWDGYSGDVSLDSSTKILLARGDSTALIVDGNTGQVLDELSRENRYSGEFRSKHGQVRHTTNDVLLWRSAAAGRFSVLGGGGRWGSVVKCETSLCAIGRNDGSIVLLDPDNGTVIAELRGHRQRINGLSFSPRHRFLASGSADGSVRVWDLEDRQQLVEMRGPSTDVTSVAFSGDGLRLATGALGAEIAVYNTPFTVDFQVLLSNACQLASRILVARPLSR